MGRKRPRGTPSAPAEAPAYGDVSFWEERHARGEREWYFGGDVLLPLLSSALPRDASIVDVGCGSSTLCFDLAAHFKGRVLATDAAPTAIAALRAAQASAESGASSARRVELIVADAVSLKLEAAAWDCCVDKGTLDALLSDKKAGAARVGAMYESAARWLRPECSVVIVSWRQPQDGLEWLTQLVLGALSSQGRAPEGRAFRWSVAIHALDARRQAELHFPAPAPLAYLIRRRVVRRSERKQRAAGGDSAYGNSEDWPPDFSYKVHDG